MYKKPKGTSDVPSQTKVPAAMRYDATGKGFDFTNARPMGYETGADPCVPPPGKPWTFEDSATMKHCAEITGKPTLAKRNQRAKEEAADMYDEPHRQHGEDR